MKSTPWIEKYRPKKLNDVVYQTNVTNILKKTVKTGNLPHIILYGKPGSGKCLAPDTPIIMYDGTIKKAKDIIIGDMLMGDNSTPRNVLSTTTGHDIMYKIIQKKGDPYIVNSVHIISLKLGRPFITSWDKIDNRYKLYWLGNHILKSKTFTVQNIKNTLNTILTQKCALKTKLN